MREQLKRLKEELKAKLYKLVDVEEDLFVKMFPPKQKTTLDIQSVRLNKSSRKADRDHLVHWIASNEQIPVEECNIPDNAEFLVVRGKMNEIVAVCTVRKVVQAQMTFNRKGSVFRSVKSFERLLERFMKMGMPVWTLMSKSSPLYDSGRKLMRRLPDSYELFFPLEKGESNVHGD